MNTSPAEKLTEMWFFNYWDDIIQLSQVDQRDDQNLLQVITMTLKIVDDTAEKWFVGRNDPDAHVAYQSFITTTGKDAHKRIAFLKKWNVETEDILESKLLQYKEMFIQAGLMHGKHRFFPSLCCGQPLEILADGNVICSSCGKEYKELY